MKETIDKIVERISFAEKEKFTELLKKCLHISKDSKKSTYATEDNVCFKIDTLFKGFKPFLYACGKDKEYESGVEALSIICDEIGIEIEKEELFILFHVRDIGKFRKKEAALHSELKAIWKSYPHYELEDKEFSYALKNLMRKKLIKYRRGSVHLIPSVILSYRQA